MIGIVILTHGGSAGAMLATLERLVGSDNVSGIAAVDVRAGEPKAEIQKRLEEAVGMVGQGEGVLICCDLHGSTPANCAVDLMQASGDAQVMVVCGVNLPMLVKLATAARAGMTLDGLAHAAVDTAVRSIRIEGGKK